MQRFTRIICLTVFAMSSLLVGAQTVFTYGTKSVSKDEFLKAFYKNNANEKIDEKTLREYLDLYSKFKLKVLAAYAAKLDTLPSQRAELQNFRSQLVLNYINDEGSVNNLVNEAFQRSQKDVRISHIFIPAPEKDTAASSKNAAAKIAEAYQLLSKGKSFEEVAATYSADPSAKKNLGDIGYITVFSLPYDLENLAYNTKVGSYSAPFRSKAGYHIIKKTDERPAAGKIKVAQILLVYPPDADATTKAATKEKADSIYKALQSGADFGSIATVMSNDNFSYTTKGELPEFGIGKFDPAFENVAFSLKKDGDISQPFQSEFGYHILKRISRNPIPTDLRNNEFADQLKQLVLGDDRMNNAKKEMSQKILKLTGYKKGVFDAKQLWAYTDSSVNDRPVPAKTTIRPNTILFSFTKQNIVASDWIAFRKSVNGVDRITAGKTDQDLLDFYVDLTALEYYKAHLEEFNKEFAFALNEFKEGNLLFEVMQRSVWDKAANDNAGLKKYFDAHKNNYWWESSAAGIYFTANNDSIANALKMKLNTGIKDWRKIVDGMEGSVLADSGRFEISQLPVQNAFDISAGKIAPMNSTQGDSSISFVFVIKLFPQREPRSYNDAKGYVINDYQTYLEQTWITELKKKYPIKVNESVLKSLIPH
ncbi:MAG TPA: peptidylprolyl isomerase [Chitinophagaceae bacterium]|nr:peptidylprolyl isomerase [Chitinophagaceae bacterium]